MKRFFDFRFLILDLLFRVRSYGFVDREFRFVIFIGDS